MRVRAAAVVFLAAMTGLVASAEARVTVADGWSLWRRPLSERALAASPPASRPLARVVSRRPGLLHVVPACLLLSLAGPVAAEPDVMTYRPCTASQFREAVSSLATRAPSDGLEIGEASVTKGPHGLVLTVPITKRVFGMAYTVHVAVPAREPPPEASVSHLTRALRGARDAATQQAVENLSRLVVTAPAQGATWEVPANLKSLTQGLGLPLECSATVAAPSVPPRHADRGGAGSARLAALD